MLRWLAGWFRPRRRGLFRFHDGMQWRYADPLRVARILAEHPQYRAMHLDHAKAGDPEAIEVCADAAREAFGLRPIDATGRGTSWQDSIEILLGFDIWVRALKKNTSNAAGSRRRSEPKSSGLATST